LVKDTKNFLENQAGTGFETFLEKSRSSVHREYRFPDFFFEESSTKQKTTDFLSQM
jgi:hypothetical protein